MARPRIAEFAQTLQPAEGFRLLLNLPGLCVCRAYSEPKQLVLAIVNGKIRRLSVSHRFGIIPRPMSSEKQFYRVATVADVPSQSGKTVRVGDQEIALFNLGGTFYAINDLCPHRGASLGEGLLDGGRVLCPWHCFDFDLQTGQCGIVTELKVSTYEIKVEGEEIFVLV